MARKKKRKKRSLPKATGNSGGRIFNPAFIELRRIKKQKTTPFPALEGKGPSHGIPEPQDDSSCFLEAMRDVQPLPEGKNRVPRSPNPDVRPAHPPKEGDIEAMTRLSDLVSGVAEMDITFSDEYMEGSVPGVSQRLIVKLRKGQIPVQDHLDLHGLTKEAAELRLRDFLLRSHQLGLRCVLVIHGRGLNSEDHIPVLKERVPVWLKRGPVRKIVLAFSTARPYDGGTGAIYILLRRRKAAT